LAVGCWLLAVGCWLLAVGCWLLAVGWITAKNCLRQFLAWRMQTFGLGRFMFIWAVFAIG